MYLIYFYSYSYFVIGLIYFINNKEILEKHAKFYMLKHAQIFILFYENHAYQYTGSVSRSLGGVYIPTPLPPLPPPSPPFPTQCCQDPQVSAHAPLPI